MNLPNKLSLIRIIMAPVILFFLVVPLGIPEPWLSILTAALFAATSITDLLDGKIARKHGLITDFGKFIDPLADKFLVISALLGIIVKYEWSRLAVVWATAIVILREFAVTSMRMIVSNKDGTVIAAGWLGKVKTTLQLVFIHTIILEPVIFGWFPPSRDWHILSWITMAGMVVMTLWSGIDYLRQYWKYLSPNK